MDDWVIEDDGQDKNGDFDEFGAYGDEDNFEIVDYDDCDIEL